MAFRVEALSFADWTRAWAEPAVAEPSAACPFQSPAYLALWLDTIGRGQGVQPVFLKVDAADGRRVMLLALGFERRRGLKVLGFLNGGLVDYTGPVRLGPAAAEVDAARLPALWDALCAALPPFDLADLDHMPAEIEGQPNPLRGWGRYAAASGWALPLDGAYADWQREANPYAADSRRKRRRLADLGPVAFEVADDPVTARRFLEAMIEQKGRRYREMLGKNHFQTPGWREHFERLTEGEGFGWRVHLSALTVGGRVVATHWGLVSGDTFYWLMPSYADGPVAKLSPGRLLMEDLIAWSYAHGLRSFDFGQGDEPYKAMCGGRRKVLLRLEAPASLAGRAALGAKRSRAAVKGFYRSRLGSLALARRAGVTTKEKGAAEAAP